MYVRGCCVCLWVDVQAALRTVCLFDMYISMACPALANRNTLHYSYFHNIALHAPLAPEWEHQSGANLHGTTWQ
jgi:hypothetical protein